MMLFIFLRYSLLFILKNNNSYIMYISRKQIMFDLTKNLLDE